MNPLYLIPLLVLLFLLRARWVMWQVQDYTAKGLYWAWQTKQSAETTQEMSQLWPGNHMLCEIWRWDFRRYVVYQGHYDEMMAFTVAELGREDRGWDIFSSSEQDSAKPDGFDLDKPPQKDDDAGHGDN